MTLGVRHGFGADAVTYSFPAVTYNTTFLLVLRHMAGILDSCRYGFCLILKPPDIFPFFCWWQAEFRQICRGWISNKTSVFDFNGKYIGNPVVLYVLLPLFFVLFHLMLMCSMFSTKELLIQWRKFSLVLSIHTHTHTHTHTCVYVCVCVCRGCLRACEC